MDFANCVADPSFGPAVEGCRDSFDFTLKFELLFFAIVPSAIFLVLAIPRTVFLSREPAVTSWRSWLYAARLVILPSGPLCIFLITALRVSLLVLSTQGTARYTLSSLFISAQGLAVAAALATAVLSHFEYSHSQRPSALLDVYLALSILLDIAHDRTLWLSASSELDTAFARVFTAALACKAVLILLESRAKSRWIVGHDQTKQSLDGTRGIYSLSSFTWLTGLFLSGRKNVLRLDDLPVLDEDMAVEALQASFAEHVKRHLGDPTKPGVNQRNKHGLLRALGDTLLVPLLLPILPRIALVGFTLSQAFLIQSVLDFLRTESASRQAGYGLIGAAILTYTGIAASTSLYWYYHGRALYMARGCLCSSVFLKTTELSVATVGKSQAVTLMSTDVDRILAGLLNLHEFWAGLVQAALGSWLLFNYLGPSLAVPIALVVASFLAVATLGRHVGRFQKAWMKETQRRVAMTANVIANMKHLKISGLAAAVEGSMQRARLTELRASRGLRRLQIAGMSISLSPELIAPAVTLAATPRDLDAPTLFTAIALLSLLTAPLGDLFKSVAPLMSALACLDRIQTYLELEPQADFREREGEKTRLPGLGMTAGTQGKARDAALRVVRGSFGWQKGGPYCLQGIDLTVAYSALTIIVGPVGSGKSTLCKALLGETPLSAGHVLVSGEAGVRIAYCDQTPFLSNSTIRDNIVGFSAWDPARYAEAVESSGLSRDLVELLDGDDTLVGSNGVILSGGQKQRIAIARALYLDARILIFDDVLSGLDANTEDHVFRHVFGPDGLLKTRRGGPAVVLCTHSVMHLPSADHIVALGERGDVVEQGGWDVLARNEGYVQSLGVKETGAEDGGKHLEAKKGIAVPQTRPSAQRPTPGVQVVGGRKWRSAAAVPGAVDGLDGVGRMAGDLTVYRHYFKAVSAVALTAFVASAVTYGFFFAFPTVWLGFWLKDAASPHPGRSKGFWIGIYGLFQALSLVGVFLTMYLAVTYVSLVSGAALHLSALRAVVRAPLSLFTTADLGTLTNYFSQDMTLVDGELPVSLINFATDLSVSVSMAGVLASSSPYLATAYPVVMALLYIVATFYLRTSRQLRLLELEAKSPLYADFLDTGRGIATIRAAHLVEDYAAQNKRLLDASQRPAYLLVMVQRWLLFMLNIFVALLAALTVTLVTQVRDHGADFAGPGLVTLLQLGQIMATTVRSYARLETSMGAVQRLKAISENTPSEASEGDIVVPPVSWPSSGRIRLDGVSASYTRVADDDNYAHGSLALKDLMLVIEPRQKVAICGRTGSGKSSFLLLLLRLLDPLPKTGEDAISIDDLSLHSIDRTVLRQRIIAVPQEAIFLPAGASWKENLDLFGACTEAECRSVLVDVNLLTSVGSQGGRLTAALKPDELSQGQKQLFSLARAVLRKRVKDREARYAAEADASPTVQPGHQGKMERANRNGLAGAGVEAELDSSSSIEPKPSHETSQPGGAGGVLLLDEVNSSMDVETERRFYDIIRREFPCYTVVMITHSLSFVAGQAGEEGTGIAGEGPGGFFDRVIVLDSGAIVEDGHPMKLLQAEDTRFRALCGAATIGNET
ncbi:Uncharacterized protein TPAR_03804 [Tolypocladium paradoxum]|uniref:ABC transporter n=1 Tax=Tolypocladium paradoxum TaxID=94208 RepID=A0A2S4L0L8_9HYPO|nr:Uncharacterized protein TPAR_03804 [Tolypocladium paradoxum]